MKKQKSYRRTLLFAFVIIGIVPLTLFSIYNFVNTYNLNEHRTETYIKSNLDIASDLIEYNLGIFSDIVEYLASDLEVVRIIKDDMYLTAERNFNDTQSLYKITQTITAGLPVDVPIHYINSRQQSRYSSTDYLDPIYTGKRGDFFAEMSKSKDVVHYIKRRVDGDQSLDVSFSMGKAIRSLEDESEIIGYVIIDIYDTYFQDIINSILVEDIFNVYIVDSNNTIITDGKYRNLTGFRFDENFKNTLEITNNYHDFGKYNTVLDSKNYVGYYRKTDVFGITIVQLISRSLFFDQSFQQLNSYIIILISLIFALIYLMSKLATYIYRPINMLVSEMYKVENGDFTANVKLNVDNEIGALGNSFNNMVQRVNKHIETDYKNQIIIQKSKLTILKAQIKPHFLYNCMNLISMMSNLGENEKVSKMSSLLSQYYRYNISNLEDIVTVKQEVEQIERYLEIQKIRYVEKLEYNISVDSSILEEKMLKLILQPIVENSIEHGIEKIHTDGVVNIDIQKSNNTIVFSILDNGPGFSKVSMNNVETINDKSKHVGLVNTIQRIKYYYGDEYGITVGRKNDCTVVVITIPISDERDDEFID